MPRPVLQAVSPEATEAAAALVRAAERFLEAGVGDGGPRLVASAREKGHRFAVLLMLPEGRARVDLVTASGERTPLFRVPGAQ